MILPLNDTVTWEHQTLPSYSTGSQGYYILSGQLGRPRIIASRAINHSEDSDNEYSAHFHAAMDDLVEVISLYLEPLQ